jgi:primosomal protein N' (replication factor Y)
MAQVLTQVAGRAGRAEKAGQVLVQTHYPAHPLINDLVHTGYHQFARKLLAERRATAAPPFSYFALLRADARTLAEAEEVLAAVRAQIAAHPVQIFGPLPAPMSRRAGLFRAQLLLNAPQRTLLHRAAHAAVICAEQLAAARRVKWSVDIDPIDFS